MFLYSILCTVLLAILSVRAQYENIDFIANEVDPQNMQLMRPKLSDFYLMQDKFRVSPTPRQPETVKVQLFYESLCPGCRLFDVQQFSPTVKKLADYLDVHVYPYGNARTSNENGKIVIKCQHGPPECYGNMLHACAIDLLQNITSAVEFNACMMGPSQPDKGSDDAAADNCGTLMNIDSEPIKQCAKSPRGFELLKAYGEESQKEGFTAVPHILINGQPNEGENFLRDVCAAFTNPPPECNQQEFEN